MYSSTVSKTFSNNLCNPLLVFVDSFLLPSINGPTSPILRSHLRVKSFDARAGVIHNFSELYIHQIILSGKLQRGSCADIIA